jgi:hypothetical protein
VNQQHHGTTPGRDSHALSRPRGRALIALGLALAVAGGIVGTALASTGPDSGVAPRTADDLRLDWQARSSGVQVLGGTRDPGVPSVQRIRHDRVVFTVTIAPARPGPNLVRVDVASLDGQSVAGHTDHRNQTVYVGTSDDFDHGREVEAQPRPGASGLWAVVDLPAGSGTVLLTHGRYHRVPFAVDTGSEPAPATFAGPDGPECLTAATAAVLAGGSTPDYCPSEELDEEDYAALASLVGTLIDRGVREIAVQGDDSGRSRSAYDLVRTVAGRAGVPVVDPSVSPASRDALLVVSGWDDAAGSLAKVTSTPPQQQPIRSDGTWLAPWLLTPAVVDSTLGAVLPLDFDIRDEGAQEFSQTLATLFPGQSPTSAGYDAWREARGGEPGPLRLYAASRAAYMPAQPGHAGHESEVAWFPGGTVTPVGSLSALTDQP